MQSGAGYLLYASTAISMDRAMFQNSVIQSYRWMIAGFAGVIASRIETSQLYQGPFAAIRYTIENTLIFILVVMVFAVVEYYLRSISDGKFDEC